MIYKLKLYQSKAVVLNLGSTEAQGFGESVSGIGGGQDTHPPHMICDDMLHLAIIGGR